jgi:hypothetical protein
LAKRSRVKGYLSICTTRKYAAQSYSVLLIKRKFTPSIVTKHMPTRNIEKPNSPHLGKRMKLSKDYSASIPKLTHQGEQETIVGT